MNKLDKAERVRSAAKVTHTAGQETSSQSRTYHLLDFNLLEGDELARPRLHRQASDDPIHPTRVRRAFGQRQERSTQNLLETLLAARLARVSVDKDVGLDVGDSRGDTPDSDESAEVGTLDVSDGQWVRGGRGERFDVEVAGYVQVPKYV